VEAVSRLIRDDRLRQTIMRNNWNYYRRHVRPDRLVLGSLMAAAARALPASGAALG
jgi:hypothetical protein